MLTLLALGAWLVPNVTNASLLRMPEDFQPPFSIALKCMLKHPRPTTLRKSQHQSQNSPMTELCAVLLETDNLAIITMFALGVTLAPRDQSASLLRMPEDFPLLFSSAIRLMSSN